MASAKKMSFQSLATLGILFTTLAAILIFLGSKFYFTQFPLHQFSVTNAITYTMLYVVGIILVNLFTVLFYAMNNFFVPNLILGVLNFIVAITLIILHSNNYSNNTLIYFYFIFFLLQGIFLAFIYFIYNKQHIAFSKSELSQLHPLFKYAAFSLCSNLIFFFTYRIDYWFVEMYCTAAELGNYIQASKLGQMLLIVPQILASAVFPATANVSTKQDTAVTIPILSRIIVQVFFVLTLLLLLIGKWLFPFVFGSSFQLVYWPMLLLMPGIACLAILVLLSAYFGGRNKIFINIMGVAIGLIVVVIADILLVKKWGIQGAAFASSVAYFFNLVFCIYQFTKHAKMGFLQLLQCKISDWIWLKQMLLSNK
ncbi:MAG: lipopolysaccharide biosynthesis protein, partial [Chitinophagaceae bacterium]